MGQISFWNTLLQQIEVLPFDQSASKIAVDIHHALKRKRKQIATPDLFIAAKAIANGLKLSTLNKKHFERIEALDLIF